MTSRARPLQCPNGHLLGHIEMDDLGWKLVFYERALDPRWPSGNPDPVIRGHTHGEIALICSVCRSLIIFDGTLYNPLHEALLQKSPPDHLQET